VTSQPNLPLRGAIDLGALASQRDAEARRSTAMAGAPAGVVIDVTTETFENDVIIHSQTVPVVLDLWATWCGPCKTLSPVLETLAAEYAGRFVLAKVDVDAEQQIAAARTWKEIEFMGWDFGLAFQAGISGWGFGPGCVGIGSRSFAVVEPSIKHERPKRELMVKFNPRHAFIEDNVPYHRVHQADVQRVVLKPNRIQPKGSRFKFGAIRAFAPSIHQVVGLDGTRRDVPQGIHGPSRLGFVGPNRQVQGVLRVVDEVLVDVGGAFARAQPKEKENPPNLRSPQRRAAKLDQCHVRCFHVRCCERLTHVLAANT